VDQFAKECEIIYFHKTKAKTRKRKKKKNKSHLVFLDSIIAKDNISYLSCFNLLINTKARNKTLA
jgi:hypothetical protein